MPAASFLLASTGPFPLMNLSQGGLPQGPRWPVHPHLACLMVAQHAHTRVFVVASQVRPHLFALSLLAAKRVHVRTRSGDARACTFVTVASGLHSPFCGSASGGGPLALSLRLCGNLLTSHLAVLHPELQHLESKRGDIFRECR